MSGKRSSLEVILEWIENNWWMILAFVIVVASFFTSGCATAKATVAPTALPLAASVTDVRIVSMDPNKEFVFPMPVEIDGVIHIQAVGMVGEVVIEYTKIPPDLEVVVEQSPDMENWVDYPVLMRVPLEETPIHKRVRETRQILSHPDTGANDRQFFRITY